LRSPWVELKPDRLLDGEIIAIDENRLASLKPALKPSVRWLKFSSVVGSIARFTPHSLAAKSFLNIANPIRTIFQNCKVARWQNFLKQVLAIVLV
jgi:hypothetical protein